MKTNSAVSSHGGRAHSPFSASGAERWFNCPASVKLSEGIVSRDTTWSIEGTRAHEVLEEVLTARIENRLALIERNPTRDTSREMINHAQKAAEFVIRKWKEVEDSDILLETRVHLPHIHPQMFGTFDAAVISHFDTLHVMDYKYGAGHAVSPRENLQMIFYAMGLAHLHHYNFNLVRVWIIQPRVRGYDGPMYWDMSIPTLMEYVEKFKKAVRNVEENPDHAVEGDWCHWCNAKKICPLKREAKIKKAQALFKPF